MAITAISGRAGNATVNSSTLAITKWTAKFNKALADSTDSSTWDGVHLFQSQVPGVLGCDGTIEGYWDAAGTTTTVLMNILTNDAHVPLVLKYDATHTAMSGNFDLENVEMTVEVPGATTVKFSAGFKSNGSFTFS